jgi:hypothetical protein
MTREQAVKARDLLDSIHKQEQKIQEIRNAYNKSVLQKAKVWVDFSVKEDCNFQCFKCTFTDTDDMVGFRNKLYELLIQNEQHKLRKLEEELEKL